MSVVGARPWTAHEDMFRRQLAASGNCAARIAVDMDGSEAAIRKRAATLSVELANMQRSDRKAKCGN
jgi:hypothetical protein